MNAPQKLPLDEDSLSYVHTLLTNNLSNEEFSYTIKVNKSPVALWSKAKEILPFERLREEFSKDDSINCIDITFRNGLKTKGGTRIILTNADEDDPDFNAFELGGYPKYQTSRERQREQEIIERERMRSRKEALESENRILTEANQNLKEQVKKAEEFADQVEKLLLDLRAKSQDKGTLEQIGDFIGQVAAYAPGLLKNTPLEGFVKPVSTAPAQNLGNTTAIPQSEVNPIQNPIPQYDDETLALVKTMQEFKPYFSQYEFQDCFKLLGLIARYKPLLGELYDLALSEVKRQVALRQQAAAKRQQMTQTPVQVKIEPEQRAEEQSQEETNVDPDTDDTVPPVN